VDIRPVKRCTPKQIAEAIQLSLSAVHEHIEACHRRLKVKNAEESLQAIRWRIDARQR
jgi:DNA-binding NarL/FixJ family response regulator